MKWAADAGFGWSRNAWAKMVRHTLLRYPVLGMSVVLTVAAPCGASPRQADAGVSAGLTREQSKVLDRYERYLARIAEQRRKARRVVRFAYRQIGKPYRWGGAGPHSYDCSGLAMTAWRHAGVRLPHRADLQYRVIPRKVPIGRLRPGDLVFFSGAGHVGIYVGHGRFIHAPHTGTVVQRGTLTGWRRRAFFGAARPGAPAYHRWPRWVRHLVARSRGVVAGSEPVRVPAASVAVAEPAAQPSGAQATDAPAATPASVRGGPATGSPPVTPTPIPVPTRSPAPASTAVPATPMPATPPTAPTPPASGATAAPTSGASG